MNPKFLLIVKPALGLNIWDTPRPQSQGAVKRRTVGKGSQLYANHIVNFQGVPYAALVPLDPNKPEWVRVSETGSAVPDYVEVIILDEDDENKSIADALNRIAKAIETMHP